MKEPSSEIAVKLRQEQTRLITIVEAIDKLERSNEWAVLKEFVFSKSVEAIERQIRVEALNETINPDRLYKLQGELAWAKQFCDIDRFSETLKKQLEEIKKRL